MFYNGVSRAVQPWASCGQSVRRERDGMFLAIIKGKVICECERLAEAGGIIQHYGTGLIAEVLYEAQEKHAFSTVRRKSKRRFRPVKRR